MVQALNLILLNSSELAELRALIKQSLSNPSGRDLFNALYSSWCHSPMATISLCLLAQAYQHASAVIQSLVEEDINVKFLVQLDKLVRLLETPIFTYLRLQLLDPGRYTWLLKTLYGLLMLLPQGKQVKNGAHYKELNMKEEKGQKVLVRLQRNGQRILTLVDWKKKETRGSRRGDGRIVMDTVEFVLQNFTEMNKFWVRLQQQAVL